MRALFTDKFFNGKDDIVVSAYIADDLEINEPTHEFHIFISSTRIIKTKKNILNDYHNKKINKEGLTYQIARKLIEDFPEEFI